MIDGFVTPTCREKVFESSDNTKERRLAEKTEMSLELDKSANLSQNVSQILS